MSSIELCVLPTRASACNGGASYHAPYQLEVVYSGDTVNAVNGKAVKKGTLSKGTTTVSLVELSTGTFKVALITKSSTGKI
ncbi:MAG: hypothetical protein WBQ21_02160 [Solirubrobacteraceae bacterium]